MGKLSSFSRPSTRLKASFWAMASTLISLLERTVTSVPEGTVLAE